MLAVTLGTCLLGNMLVVKWVIGAGERTITRGQGRGTTAAD